MKYQVIDIGQGYYTVIVNIPRNIFMNLTEARRRIQKAKELSLTELDLSNCELATPPDELKEIGQTIIVLNVASNALGKDGAALVAAYCPNLKSLKIGKSEKSRYGNLILAEGARAIARLHHLTYLDISDNSIGNDGAEAIALLRNLTELDISDNAIDSSGATAIATLKNLTYLNIGGNIIGDKGAVAISNLNGLTKLDIHYNSIGNKGAKAISKLSNLTILDAHSNDISDSGAISLSKLINLTDLDVGWNKIKHEGAKAIASLSSLTKLDISWKQIGDRGARYLSSLKSLTYLDVGYNEIGEEGARAIATLDNLTELDIAGNIFGEQGATSIAALTNLEDLNIAGCSIKDKGAITISTLVNLKKLRVGDNGIGPKGAKAISSLINLRELEISGFLLGDAGAQSLSDLHELSELRINHSSLTALGARAIASLHKLTVLDISGNKIGIKGAKEIAQLTNLKHLSIYGSELGAEGAKAISNLLSLEYLDIRSNAIGSTGAKELSKLYRLKSLTIDDNQIGSEGAWAIGKLTNLEHLDLRYNSIGDEGAKGLSSLIKMKLLCIDSSSHKKPEIKISGLQNVGALEGITTNLRNLRTGRESRSTLRNRNPNSADLVVEKIDPRPIGDEGAKAISLLTNLRELNLIHNRVGDEGAIALSSLSLLTRFVLGDNLITSEGAKAIAGMLGLNDLLIWGNGISDEGAKALATLPNLNDLNIGNNFVSDEGLKALALSPTLIKARLFSVSGNRPVNIPKEIAEDISKLRSYFIALSYGKERGNSVRIILCGNTLAGKTSLAAKFDDINNESPHHNSRTHGIRHWQPAQMIRKSGTFVNIWDFGGQDYYHATHTAALSTGKKKEDNIHTIYLLLWRSCTDVYKEAEQQMPLDYWLGFIEAMAGLDATVEMVQTHADKDHQEKYPFGAKMLQEELFNLSNNRHYLSLNTELINKPNTKERKLWKQFEEKIFELVKQKAQSADYPKIWERVRTVHLPEIAGTKDLIDQYNQPQNDNRHIIDKKLLKLEFLTTAALAHIQVEERVMALQYDELLDYLRRCGEILYWKESETNDPLLLKYVVINIQRFHQVIYEEILTEKIKKQGGFFVPAEHHAFYLQYLIVNDLIFKENAITNRYVAPQYLPEPPRKRLVSKLFKIHLYIHFPYYMPRYLISRFIVMVNRIGKNIEYWKYDCECEIEDIDVVTSADIENQQIVIYTTEEALNSGLLKKLFYYFISYGKNNLWEQLSFSLPDLDRHIEVSIDGTTFFEIRELKKINKQIARTTTGDNAVVPNIIWKLLDNQTNKMHNIFISYSKNDLDLLKELELAFASLQRQGKICLWTDAKIDPGTDWDVAIKHQLANADTVLCMISPGMIANDYVMNVEIPLAKSKLGDNHVIPVFATAVDIEGLDFDRWQGMLTKKQYPNPIDDRHCQNGIYWLRNIPKDQRDIYYAAIVKELRKRYNW
jgi:Leucine-rich repeat (LRR) protein